MKYFIFSRPAAIKFIDHTTAPTLIISITDPHKEPAKFRNNTKVVKTLRVAYHFVSKKRLDSGDIRNKVPFSLYEAERIRDCVAAYKDQVSQIVVHGELGIGRSAGVMAAIKEWLEGDDGGIWTDPRYRADTYSYKLMVQAIYGEEAIQPEKETPESDKKMMNTNPDGSEKGEVRTCYFPRQTYINGSCASRAHCLGYCWLFRHRGYLNRKLLEEHNCIGKNCPMLQKFEDHPYWISRNAAKKSREEGKAKRRREEAEKAQLLRAFREATLDIEDFAVCGIEKDGDTYIMRCVAMDFVNLWDAIQEVQEELDVYVRVKFIRNTSDIRQRLVDKYLTDPDYLVVTNI